MKQRRSANQTVDVLDNLQKTGNGLLVLEVQDTGLFNSLQEKYGHAKTLSAKSDYSTFFFYSYPSMYKINCTDAFSNSEEIKAWADGGSVYPTGSVNYSEITSNPVAEIPDWFLVHLDQPNIGTVKAYPRPEQKKEPEIGSYDWMLYKPENRPAVLPKNFPIPIETIDIEDFSGGTNLEPPETHSNLESDLEDWEETKRLAGNGVKKAPKPEIKQIDEVRPAGRMGVSLGLSRALLRAGLAHYARAMEILADYGHLGKVLTKVDFTGILEEYMGKEPARSAFDEFSGKSSHRHSIKKAYKHNVLRGRETFFELLVNFVRIKYLSIERTIFTKNPLGGRPNSFIYVPTEPELSSLLLSSGLLNTLDRDELSQWIEKPLEVLANQTKYKAFIMSTKIFQEGKGDYSRKSLAENVGMHMNTVRKYAEMMDIKVETNPPSLKPIRREEIHLLPADKLERDRWIELKKIPAGAHIRDGLGKLYIYTQPSAWRALEKSKKIFMAAYKMSTYDPSGSEFSPST